MYNLVIRSWGLKFYNKFSTSRASNYGLTELQAHMLPSEPERRRIKNIGGGMKFEKKVEPREKKNPDFVLHNWSLQYQDYN